MSLDIDSVVQNYLHEQRPNDWPSDKLHVTDLSACPRQVALRVLGAPMRSNTPSEDSMFDLANYQHDRFTAALSHAGMLAFRERPMETLPDGWSGRADYGRFLPNGRVRIGDVKTTHPNGLKRDDYGNPPHTYPKPEHIMQVSTYYYYSGYKGDLDDLVEIAYMDRGGSNPSLLVEFEPLPKEIIDAAIESVQEAVDAALAGNLPPILPMTVHWGKTYQDKQGRQTGGKILYGPDWRCTRCRALDCPAERVSHEIGQLTKTRGLEMRSEYEHMRSDVNIFLEMMSELEVLG